MYKDLFYTWSLLGIFYVASTLYMTRKTNVDEYVISDYFEAIYLQYMDRKNNGQRNIANN